MGVPDYTIYPGKELLLYNYTLSPLAALGYVNHFWSTACGGRAVNFEREGGTAIYRLYLDGESSASIVFTPRSAVGLGPFDPAAGDAKSGSLMEPWGNELFQKLSDMDAFNLNVKIPFYKSIRLTAELPQGTPAYDIYTIIRGVETDASGNPPLQLPGYGALPLGTRMLQVRQDNVTLRSLAFSPIVNITEGNGLIAAHSVSVSGNGGMTFLEGCFHLITPVTGAFDNTTGVAAGFPGVPLSTGTEDYYSSSFYFHAGLFAQADVGVTHMCGTSNVPWMKPCPTGAGNQGEWSAYRVHDRDPLLFQGGVQLLMRNGDVEGPTWYGTGKCFNLDMSGGPGESTFWSTAWVYLFP
jgi:hypothetical protein